MQWVPFSVVPLHWPSGLKAITFSSMKSKRALLCPSGSLKFAEVEVAQVLFQKSRDSLASSGERASRSRAPLVEGVAALLIRFQSCFVLVGSISGLTAAVAVRYFCLAFSLRSFRNRFRILWNIPFARGEG